MSSLPIPLRILPLLLLATLATPLSSQTTAANPHWHHQPLRITQIVLREPDAKDYDVPALIDYLQATASNTLVINAGGIVDFFQNPLPAANINPFLDGRDLLRDITDACHAANIKVIARVDFRGVEKHIFDQHPDWFARNADQSPQTLNYTRPELYVGCYTGHYRNAHAETFVDHILTEYQVDGIWHNSIAVYGICYCPACSTAYQQATGQELPVEGSSPSAALDRYMTWKTTTAEAHMDHMRATVKAHGEDKAYVAEVFGMFDPVGQIHSGIDLYTASERFDFLVSVAFIRPNRAGFLYENIGYASSVIKLLKALDPSKEAIALFGSNGTAHRYVQEPQRDTRLWLWETLAAGGRFWNCNFTGQNPASTYDRRAAFVAQDAYQLVAKNADTLASQAPLAEIGIYYSNTNRIAYQSLYGDRHAFGDTIKGYEQVLRDQHLQYTFIPDRGLSAESLSRFQTIILPNVALMTDHEAALFEAYVKNGGRLIASYQTSLYDETGAQRPNFALAPTFGIHSTTQPIDTEVDTYQKIIARTPLTNGFEETDLLVNAGQTQLVQALNANEVILAHIPKVHNQPPEKAWIDTMDSGHATLVHHRHGQGQVLYFANSIGRLVQSGDNGDFHALLSNALNHLVPNLLIQTNAPASVQITLAQNTDGTLLLSLINHSSGQRRPLSQLIPVHDIEIELTLPHFTYASHQILSPEANTQLTLTPKPNTIQIHLDRLTEFTTLAIQPQ